MNAIQEALDRMVKQITATHEAAEKRKAESERPGQMIIIGGTAPQPRPAEPSP